MGLPIAKALVTAHKGTLGVTSQLGHGSVFSFSLPVARRAGAINMNDASILVADDEPQIRRVLRSTLSSHGYVIIEAKSGEEAVEAVRKEKPDLVLLDVNMPGIGGIEACREIRQSSDAPIIMLTVRNAERDKVLALDAGRTIMWVKPFGIEELLARIRAALRRYSPGDTLPPFVSRTLLWISRAGS